MSMIVCFSATKLANSNKEGVLKPDADGYYTMTLGALNSLNSAGSYYPAKEAIKLFEDSSILMRRIKSGTLKGELGHPKQNGMRLNEYVERILHIEETNVCCHYSDIWLDDSFGKANPQFNNPNLVGIIGKVKPSGPKGNSLKESLENKKENVCFSIRSFTRDGVVNGVNNKVLDTIVTWDCVNEPGIAVANKWDNPSLEEVSNMIIPKKSIENVIAKNLNMGMEDSKLLAKEVLKMYELDMKKKPNYLKW